MTKRMKYQIRRLIAAALLVGLLTIFTSIVIEKAIDTQIHQDEVMMKEHRELWQIK